MSTINDGGPQAGAKSNGLFSGELIAALHADPDNLFGIAHRLGLKRTSTINALVGCLHAEMARNELP